VARDCRRSAARCGLGLRSRRFAVAADKAYSSRTSRAYLRRRGIKAIIPEKADQAANRKKRGRDGGWPVAYDAEQYKERNMVERCINKIRAWRGPATRYDRRPRATWRGW
jgi:transposase